MRRTPALVVLAAAGLTIGIGTGHALTGHDGPAQLVSTSTPFADDPSTTVVPPSTAVPPTTAAPSTTLPSRPTTEPTTEAPSTTVPADGHHEDHHEGGHDSPSTTEPHEHATPPT